MGILGTGSLFCICIMMNVVIVATYWGFMKLLPYLISKQRRGLQIHLGDPVYFFGRVGLLALMGYHWYPNAP